MNPVVLVQWIALTLITITAMSLGTCIAVTVLENSPAAALRVHDEAEREKNRAAGSKSDADRVMWEHMPMPPATPPK